MSIGESPVTQVAEAEVKRLSIKGVDSPLTVQTGRQSISAPAKPADKSCIDESFCIGCIILLLLWFINGCRQKSAVERRANPAVERREPVSQHFAANFGAMQCYVVLCCLCVCSISQSTVLSH